jgi:choline dehydrogenase-like flavoprotein
LAALHNDRSLLEQLPEPGNRVTLDPDASDIYGVPLPRIAYRLGSYIEVGHAMLIPRFSRRREPRRSIIVTPLKAEGTSWGTARTGNDPKDSVVDRDLRSHDHPNLVILGLAVFPTGATANPTLIIAALSLRAVGRVKAILTQ